MSKINLKEVDKNILKKGYTHGGVFHADDVFSAAFLKILNPDIVIERGMTPPEEEEGLIIFDIGYGKYDHHQKNKRVRDNGVAYAAFGLLFEEFGECVMEEKDKIEFDKGFVQKVDYCDNTGENFDVSNLISEFLPDWGKSSEMDKRFFDAVDFAIGILNRKIHSVNEKRKAYYKVIALLKEDERKNYDVTVNGGKRDIFVLNTSIQWKEAVIETSKKFVIYPSLRGGFMIQGVPVNKYTKALRKEFPKKWRGLSPEKLAEVTGIKTATFCHNSGFLACTETLDDAVKLAKLALES